MQWRLFKISFPLIQIYKHPHMTGFGKINKPDTLTYETITKPFIFKEKMTQSKKQAQSLYSCSHVYLHPMVLDTMRVSWGSEATLTNPKNKKTTIVCVFSSDCIPENGIEMDECIQEQLDVKYGMCIYVTAKTQNRVLHISCNDDNQDESKQGEKQVSTQLQYAYDKTESYELISKIINNKLKIQLKSLKYRDAPKLYYLQQSDSIENFPLSQILNFLQHQEYYQVYPEKGIIQIITTDATSISIELNELRKPKTIDTEIIMTLIGQLFKLTQKSPKKLENIDNFEVNQKITEQEDIDQKIYTAKPFTFTSYQKTTQCDTFGKQTNQDQYFDRQIQEKKPKIVKIGPEPRTTNSLPKNIFVNPHLPEIRNMQDQIKKISDQIQQLQSKLSTHSEKKDSATPSLYDRMEKQHSQGTSSIHGNQRNQIPEVYFDYSNKGHQNFLYRLRPFNKKLSTVQQNSSFHQLQSNIKFNEQYSIFSDQVNHLDYFTITEQIPEKITSEPFIYTSKITYKLQFEWSLISPVLIRRQFGPSRHQLKILNSQKNFIFFGLMKYNNKKHVQKSLWMKEGSIGCFVYNSKVYLNGNQISSEKGLSELLAKEGQVIEIKVNKIFKEIQWIVDGKKKLKIKSPELFKEYNFGEDWVAYAQLFAQGDSVEFISELL